MNLSNITPRLNHVRGFPLRSCTESGDTLRVCEYDGMFDETFVVWTALAEHTSFDLLENGVVVATVSSPVATVNYSDSESSPAPIALPWLFRQSVGTRRRAVGVRKGMPRT